MRHCKSILPAILIGLALQQSALAAEPGPAHAVALAEKGARFVKENGREEMAKRINGNDPMFRQGSLYLAMRDLNGITVAHPTAALIGKNLLDVPDADGKLFRREMVAIANGAGKGWVHYKFTNPESFRVENKSTYVLRAGDVALEAGIYRP